MPQFKPIPYLQRLMRRYVSGKASRPEAEFLDKWYDHFGQRPGDELDEAALRERDRVLLEALNQRIDSQEGARVRSLYVRRVWQVAAMLLIIAGGYWFLRPAAGKADVPGGAVAAVMTGKDKGPGGNKAVLTLANGQQIALGSGSRGVQQGQVATIVLDSGSVSYRGDRTGGGAEVYNTLATPRGGQYRVVLADGTKVWLNSTSSLRFPERFSTGQRVVELSGEAYFEVAHDQQHPFVVKTADMDVKVLGTSFNVMAYPNEPQHRTTLIEGSVRLSGRMQDAHSEGGQELRAGVQDGLLRPGEQGGFDKGVLHIGSADTESAMAWKEGKFRFTNADIQTIMRQVARWYDVEVEYKGALPVGRLSGAFSRLQNVSNLLELLEEACDAHFSMEGNTVVVTATTH